MKGPAQRFEPRQEREGAVLILIIVGPEVHP